MEALNNVPSISQLDLRVPWTGRAVISPEDAARLLATTNVGNRLLMRGPADYITRQIANGEWQSDHPSRIVFSDKGRLIDGQHRLFGIEKAQIGVVASVETGARDALRRYMDTGTSRRLHDRVAFDRDPLINRNLAPMVTFLCDYLASDGQKTRKPSPDEALEMFSLHKHGLLFAVNYLARRQRGVTAIAVMVALVELFERDPAKAEAFAESLVLPDGPVQQARRLRDWLLSTPLAQGHGAANQRVRYAKAVGAMQAYLDERTVQVIRAGSWSAAA